MNCVANEIQQSGHCGWMFVFPYVLAPRTIFPAPFVNWYVRSSKDFCAVEKGRSNTRIYVVREGYAVIRNLTFLGGFQDESLGKSSQKQRLSGALVAYLCASTLCGLCQRRSNIEKRCPRDSQMSVKLQDGGRKPSPPPQRLTETRGSREDRIGTSRK